MPGSNYAAMIAKSSGAASKSFVAVIALVIVILSFLYAGVLGLIVCAAIILGYAAAMRVVYKSFKGVSGDLLGYAMVISELCGVITLAVLQGVYL
jgi:adenosylcobinamide-GDP ribazoletransferase